AGPLSASHVFHAAMPFVLGAHLAFGVVWLVKPVLHAPPVVALAGGAVLSYAATILVALAFGAGREALREALRLIPARGFLAAPSEAK
ncbi:MAG: lipopolysaccharide biosynthesis protein, partial [Alphaproteobacteria bacterium]|nr:lipopolysaccharide biosynthesis protein [Alphaproteobacteria bacterium]